MVSKLVPKCLATAIARSKIREIQSAHHFDADRRLKNSVTINRKQITFANDINAYGDLIALE